MNPITRAWHWFYPPGEPTRLRNKPGGLAWINSNISAGINDGSAKVVGQVVRTVHVTHDDFWHIEPRPEYVLARDIVATDGTRGLQGQRIGFTSLRDHCLTPFDADTPDDSEVRDLYAPQETVNG